MVPYPYLAHERNHDATSGTSPVPTVQSILPRVRMKLRFETSAQAWPLHKVAEDPNTVLQIASDSFRCEKCEKNGLLQHKNYKNAVHIEVVTFPGDVSSSCPESCPESC